MLTRIAFIIALCAVLCASCGGIEPEEQAVVPTPPTIETDPGQPPYCGDGICDESRGEDEWWCVDCGYSLLMNGPKDGGYCGDGVCFGGETMLSCFKDCQPRARKGQFDELPWDPDWTDPFPPMNPLPPGPPPPEQMERRILLEKEPFGFNK